MAYTDPFWTLNEAVSWAMWRLPEALQFHPYYIVDFDEDASFPGYVQRLSLADAERGVLNLLKRGRIRASAGGQPLTPDAVAACEISDTDGRLVLGLPLDDKPKPNGGQTLLATYFQHLRLNSDDIRLHLPSENARTATVLELAVKEGARIAPRRGRPPKYDWASFDKECKRVWDYQGGFVEGDIEFSRQADLVRMMTDWCAANVGKQGWPDEPSLSQIKLRVSQFLTDKDAAG